VRAKSGVDLILTNDERFSRKHVPGVTFITSLERAHHQQERQTHKPKMLIVPFVTLLAP
jgi:hypothetical protein